MVTSRRSFITGIVGLIAAPAVLKYSSLMPISSLPSSRIRNHIQADFADYVYTVCDINGKFLFGNSIFGKDVILVPKIFLSSKKKEIREIEYRNYLQETSHAIA